MIVTSVYAIISVLIVSLISLVGVATMSLYSKNIQKTLLILVSLSAGTLFGGAFLHLLPEAVELNGFTLTVSSLLLAGILVFFLLEKFIHWHHCHAALLSETKRKHAHSHMHSELHIKDADYQDKKHIAVINLVGDGIHNFLDGLIIAVSYLLSIPIGIATTAAVILHEVPQEIADFGVLLYSGLTKRKALWFNFLSAIAAIVGAITGLVLGSRSELFISVMVPFAAGGFIYIAGSNLIPELHKECGLKDSFWHFFAFLLGILAMAGLKLIGLE
ncbi:ZIP family metal transporter [Candidatus Woesearchaeota archaeon]|nr:ZIP family metal transporter [Candidatus Woesearchaeota archaeon]